MSSKNKKEQRQKQWGLTVDKAIPMVLVSEIDDHIQQILDDIIDGVAAVGIQLVVVEPHSEHQKQHCRQWHDKHPQSVTVVSVDDIEDGVCDMAVLEEVTIDRLKELAKRNLVPVAARGIEPFDPVAEKGNGFVFLGDSWTLFAALIRAAETYRFPYDWKNVIKAVKK